MKNGIAMIGKLSKPVNSFIDTDSIGTSLRTNKKVSTVRPSAIETGVPVAMNVISRMKIMIARIDGGITMTPVLAATQIARTKIGARISDSARGVAQQLETVPCSSAGAGSAAILQCLR